LIKENIPSGEFPNAIAIDFVIGSSRKHGVRQYIGIAYVHLPPNQNRIILLPNQYN
jgi:hypothetical protein